MYFFSYRLMYEIGQKPVSLRYFKHRNMKTASFTEFRQNMKQHLESIEKDQDILILSGPKNKGYVVLTLDQFEAMEETAHLLSTPANAARLAQGLKEAEGGKVITKKLKL